MYKILRNKSSSLIKKSKRDFFNNAIKENKDSTYLWKNLKDISNLNHANKIELPQRLIISDKKIEGNLNIVNELNKHFKHNYKNFICKRKLFNFED